MLVRIIEDSDPTAPAKCAIERMSRDDEDELG
jgi:hypothetical protein